MLFEFFEKIVIGGTLTFMHKCSIFNQFKVISYLLFLIKED
jgi:hypothetical protein